MIIWSGKGLWILLFFNIIFWGIILLTPLDEMNKAPAVIGCFCTALFSLVMGQKWNRETYDSIILKEQGYDIEIKPLSSLFWIRMENWFYILLLIGILIWAGVFDSF